MGSFISEVVIGLSWGKKGTRTPKRGRRLQPSRKFWKTNGSLCFALETLTCRSADLVFCRVCGSGPVSVLVLWLCCCFVLCVLCLVCIVLCFVLPRLGQLAIRRRSGKTVVKTSQSGESLIGSSGIPLQYVNPIASSSEVQRKTTSFRAEKATPRRKSREDRPEKTDPRRDRSKMTTKSCNDRTSEIEPRRHRLGRESREGQLVGFSLLSVFHNP